MTNISLATSCTAPCEGTPNSCVLGELLRCLDQRPSLTLEQVELLRVNAAHCVQIADALRTAIDLQQ